MFIKGSDIEEGVRKRMLLDAHEVFEVKDLGLVPDGCGYRRFELFQDGVNRGIVYEDQLSDAALEELLA